VTARRLRGEFDPLGVAAGRVHVYGESAALALIDRAEDEYVAVVSVEPVWEDDLLGYSAQRRRLSSEVERLRSWENAREFVTGLSGRGLYFDVILESSFATYAAKLRYLFRTGSVASGDRRGGRGGTIQ